MPNRIPPTTTPEAFAKMWAKEILEPAVKTVSGRDGKVTAREASKEEKLSGNTKLAADNLKHLHQMTGYQRPSAKTLLETGYQYALAQAQKAAKPDGTISLAELDRLPENLRADFKLLQTREAPGTTRPDTKGYRLSHRVLDQILQEYNITDAQALIDKAISSENGNKYLSKKELAAAAKDLNSTNAESPSEGFRWTPSVMARVKSRYLQDDEDALLMEATKFDNGNKYLSKKELEKAARSLLQHEEIGIISDLDKTIIPKHRYNHEPVPKPYPGIATLLKELELGQGRKAGDIGFVTARSPDRVTEIPEYLEDHEIPAGPIETGTSPVPWVAQPEKVRDVSKFLDANPDQNYVLFGDSSHRDPEVYKEILDKYPGRIHAGFIHKVTDNIPAERTEGLHLIENYAEAAAILYKKGVLDQDAAKRVMLSAKHEGLDITEDKIKDLLQNHRP